MPELQPAIKGADALKMALSSKGWASNMAVPIFREGQKDFS
jgi:hypothetical protein